MTGNVIWVHVKGIGYAGVYAPPSGSSNRDPLFIDITNCLAAGVKAHRLKERVWIMGDTNARIGELPNEVGEARTPRTSEDKVVNQRGRDLMRALNAEGMWVVNGSREKAAVTFENHSGASCIDLVWTSEYQEVVKGCKEWADAVCTFSDHIMITVRTNIQEPKMELATQRKEAWKRQPRDEWTNCTNIAWGQVSDMCKPLSIHMHWENGRDALRS